MPDPQTGSAPVAPAMPHGKAFKGFLLALAGLLLFACMDASTKYLTAHYNVPFVVAMRYLIHCGLMLLLLAPRHAGSLVKTQRTGLVVLRGATLVVSSLCVGLALQRMPLAETTAINFLAPMLVMLVASPVLGERIGTIGWLAAGAGFIGVLLIARPGGGLDALGVLFAMGAVISNCIYQLLSRILARTEKAVAMLFYTALVGSIVFGSLLPWSWESDTPSQTELVLFGVMGLSAALGHYLFTLAYRYAAASVLSPVLYLQLLWAALLGWLIFGTLPDALATVGMIIIAASGFLMAFKMRWGGKAKTKK